MTCGRIKQIQVERLSAKKDISKQPSVILDFNLSDMCEVEEVANEDIIVVKYSDDFWLCTFDYQRIGKLVGENISRLEVVDRRNYDLIVEDFVRKEAKVSIRVV